MYRDIPDELRRVIEPIVADHGLEIVDARLAQGRGSARVQVVVDNPAGDGRVTVDRCAEVSREIGRGLDVADLIPGSYVLEVCSPGVDRTLGREIDFERCVGREVALETREPLAGRRRWRGELVEFRDGLVRVRTPEGEFGIPFESIAKARAFHDFGAAKR